MTMAVVISPDELWELEAIFPLWLEELEIKLPQVFSRDQHIQEVHDFEFSIILAGNEKFTCGIEDLIIVEWKEDLHVVEVLDSRVDEFYYFL